MCLHEVVVVYQHGNWLQQGVRSKEKEDQRFRLMKCNDWKHQDRRLHPMDGTEITTELIKHPPSEARLLADRQ
jgi:hypothetical protein